MDSTTVGPRVARMWAKMARTFEAAAYNLAESGSSLDRDAAMNFAKYAEVCFWRSTGEDDAISMRDMTV